MTSFDRSKEQPMSYDPTAPMRTPQSEQMSTPPRDTRSQPSTQQQVQQTAEAAKAKGQEMMDRAQQQADVQRQMTADRLGGAADALRDKQQQLPGGETTQRVASTAADKMDQASTYLQQHDMNDIVADLQGFARAHPTETLVAAVALGFLVGRSLRS